MFQLYQNPRAATIRYKQAIDPTKKYLCIVLGVLIEEHTMNVLYLLTDEEHDSTINAPWWADAADVEMYIGAR